VAGALASVDVEDFAGHEAGAFEVEDRVDDVGDLAQSADRVQSSELRVLIDGMHWRLGARRYRVHSDTALSTIASDLVAAFRPPFVNAASTAGKSAMARSTRLVVICTMWPLPCFSISATASCVM